MVATCSADFRQLAIFFTGLSGAGKTTLSARLVAYLEQQEYTVTAIDGDVLRGMLSSDLGFSRRDRELNLQRAAYVAGEVVRHQGVVVCAMIAPYQAAREQAREYVEAQGGRFVEVYLSTPLAVCEARDPKGMYARARRGEIQQFTGIDDVFEAPVASDIVIDTSEQSEDAAFNDLLEQLSILLASTGMRLVTGASS